MASIRARLTVTYAAALVATLGAFGATLWVGRRAGADQELQRHIVENAEVVQRLLLGEATRIFGDSIVTLPLVEVKDTIVGPLLVARAQALLGAVPEIVLVADTTGRLVYGSTDARLLVTGDREMIAGYAARLKPSTEAAKLTIERDTITWGAYIRFHRLATREEVLIARLPLGPELAPLSVVITGAPTREVQRAQQQFLGSMLAIAPFLLLVSIGVAYYMAGDTLRPLEFVRTEVEAITDGRSLHRRLPVEESGDEMARLAATLNEMIGRLETSFGGLRRFTADASHELKTPLTVLRANVERAMSVPHGSPDQMIALEEALQETARMADLVDSLLTLARFDEGRFDLHREPVALEPVVRDVLETAVILGESADLTIALAVCEEVAVLGDPARLRQLFLNLVTNAIKYTPPGGTVELSLRRTDDVVVFAVRDTGIGIAAADLPYIFDRFWRADRARSRRTPGESGIVERAGFGLGLAISQWIAQAHGGTLAVVSRLTRGTTFTVSLPVLRSLSAPPLQDEA